jgi:serine/threonine-protein kinase
MVTKARERHPLDELLGVDTRPFEDEELTQVLSSQSNAEKSAEVTLPPVTDAAVSEPLPARARSSPNLSVAGLAESSPSPVGNFESGDADGLAGVLVDGRYRVKNVLGSGGIGLVYLCQHELLQKPVAMKVLRPEYVSHEDLNERFRIEARAASSIKSARIVETIDVGTLPNGAPYFVMDYVEGETLASLLERDGLVSLPQALEIARQVAEGLVAAHAAGVVHRDLKPENVFLALQHDGAICAKLFDFGIAKVAGQRKRLTYVGAVFGTPTYMSPEQARGEAVDERADLYALGIMIFEMLSGTVPFDGEDPLAIMAQHVDRPAPPLSSVCAIPIPPLLERIVQRCLEKSPSARYPSAAALLDDLNAIDPDAPVERTPPPPPPPVFEPQQTRNTHVVPAYVQAPPPPKRKSYAPRALLLAATILAGAGWAAWTGVWPLGAEGVDATRPGTKPTPKMLAATPAETEEDAEDASAREVHFVLFPLDAHVFRGEQDLGPMPVSIRVQKGQPVSVTVRRKGFSTRKLVIDGKESRVVIRLVKGNEATDARRHAATRPPARTENSSANVRSAAPTKRPPTRATTPTPRSSAR